MDLNNYLKLSPEVADALLTGNFMLERRTKISFPSG